MSPRAAGRAWRAAWLVAAAMGLGTAGAARAAAPEPPAPAEPVHIAIVGAPPQARTGRWDPQAGVWEFDPPQGAHVQVHWGEWEARARRVRWQPGQQVAELTGDVVVRRPDLEATAERALVQVERRLARLEGNVRAVQREPGAGGGRPVRTVTARVVELDEQQQQVRATGEVRVEQEEPSFWAEGDTLVYRQAEGRLILTDAEGVDGEAQGYRLSGAARLELQTETGELALFGPAILQSVPASGGP